MKRPKKEKKFTLDEIADYMDRQDLGELNINEVEDIGEFIEDLKMDSQEENEYE